MTFCEKLQQLRKSAELTQDEFAERIGVSRQAISKWESGASYPDLKNLQTICDYFNCSPDSLLNDERSINEEPIDPSYTFDPTGIGSRIRTIRGTCGIGQEHFAELLEVSRQSVSKWENGAALPKIELLLSIMRVLETNLYELLPPVPEKTEILAAPLPEEPSHDAAESAPADLPANTEESISTVPAVAEESAQEPPKKRRRRVLPFILIPLAAVLLCVMAAGAYLVMPFLVSDPFENLFRDLFSPVEDLNTVSQRWVNAGAEITIGVGETAISAKIKVTDTEIILGGLSEKPVTLPRQNVAQALENSPFHYLSDTPVSLTYEQYDSLLSFLESLEYDPDEDATELEKEALAETLEEILRISEETLNPEVKYRLIPEQFALEKTVTVEADLSTMLDLLRAIAAEVKQNESLNGILSSVSNEALSNGEKSETLDALILELEHNLLVGYRSKKLTFSYTVVDGKFTKASLTDQSVDTDKISYDTLLELTTYQKKNDAGFTLKISSKSSFEGDSETEETKIDYRKITYENKTEIFITVENRMISDSDKSSHSYMTQTTATLVYDKNTNKFDLRITDHGTETNSRIQGTWELNAEKGICRFGLDLIEHDGTAILSTNQAILSVTALGEGAFPGAEGTDPLLSLSAEQLMTMYRQLPAKKAETILKEITGEKPDITYSKQNEPVLPSTQALAQKYAKAYKSYVNEQEAAQYIPTSSVRLYSEEHRMHILLDCNSVGNVTITYTDSLTPYQIRTYHEATYKSSKLHVHTIEKTSHKDPTCTGYGRTTYKCTDCDKSYSVSIASTGHRYVQYSMKVLCDDNVSRVATYEQCPNCKTLFWVKIKNNTGGTLYLLADLAKNSTGGYTVTSYSGYIDASLCAFSIPDELCKKLNINNISGQTFSNFDLIRIPNGVTKISTYTFSNASQLQVLVLPSTLKEISNDAFTDTSNLHTIYFCGSEAQWNSVKLGRYRDEWSDVNVVFSPNGVSPAEIANSFLTHDKIVGAISAARDRTHLADTAIDFAKNEGVTLVDQSPIQTVLYDRVKETVVVIGCYTESNPQHTVSVYSAVDFSLISQFTIDYEIGLVAAWDGVIATSVLGGSEIDVFKQSDGSRIYTVNHTSYYGDLGRLNSLVIVDGYVYYSNSSDVYCCPIGSSTPSQLLGTDDPYLLVNHEQHRLLIKSTIYSPAKLYFVDTQTREWINTLQILPEFPWEEEFSYVSIANRMPTIYYDLDGNELSEPPTQEVPVVTYKRDETLDKVALKNDKINVTVACNAKGEVYLLVQKADGEQIRIDYYATSAILLSNGTILLYNVDGCGLVAVSV